MLEVLGNNNNGTAVVLSATTAAADDKHCLILHEQQQQQPRVCELALSLETNGSIGDASFSLAAWSRSSNSSNNNNNHLACHYEAAAGDTSSTTTPRDDSIHQEDLINDNGIVRQPLWWQGSKHSPLECSWSLSSSSSSISDDDDNEDDNDDFEHYSCAQERRVRSCPQGRHSKEPDTTDSNCAQRQRRVRFCQGPPQVKHYEKPDTKDSNRLYYSCHELQKIVDEYRSQQDEWHDECIQYDLNQAECHCNDDDDDNNGMLMCEQESSTESAGDWSTASPGGTPTDSSCWLGDDSRGADRPTEQKVLLAGDKRSGSPTLHSVSDK